MEKKKKKVTVSFSRMLCVILSMIMVFSFFSVAVFADEGATTSPSAGVVNANENKKREINVVFDNSGSMYMESRSKEQIDRWCYAKYAMEAFVATLNSNDILRVYPMNDITTTGRDKPGTDPIVINGKDKAAGIEKIRNMFSTEKNGETPFTPVTKAADGFTDANSAKYLVVITDGNFQPDIAQTSETLPNEQVIADLEKIQNRGIEVLFLRIGDKNVINANVSYKKGVNDTSDIISAVNDVCNRIFQRIELDDEYIDDNSLNLPISMSKIVVFAQGDNAKAGVIRLPGGTNINPISSEHIKYSDKSSADGGKVETKLNGYVATYAIPGGVIGAGKYDIDAAGDIAVFYEPAIDIKYTLKDPVTGSEVVPGEKNEIPAGDYIIEMQFLDAVTGDDVTDHELLEGDNDNVLYAKLLDSEGKQVGENIENGKTITLTEADSAYIEVVGTYLDDYTITNNGQSNFGPLKIKNNPFKIKLDVANDYFCIKTPKSWDNFIVSFTVNGNAVSEDDFAKVKLTKEDVKIENVKVDFEIIRNDENNTYEIKLLPKSAERGKGKILVSPKLYFGEENVASDSAAKTFRIEQIPQAVLIGTISLIIGLILGLIIWFLFIRKVLPKKMWIDIEGDGETCIRLKGNSVRVIPSDYSEALTFSVKKNCNFWNCYIKKNPSFLVTAISVDSIDTLYIRNIMIDLDSENIKPIDIRGSANQISWESFMFSSFQDANIRL